MCLCTQRTASFVFSSPESSVFGSDVALPFLFLFVHSEPGDIVINLFKTDNYKQEKASLVLARLRFRVFYDLLPRCLCLGCFDVAV
jgi:hypothetical protein